MNSSVEIESFDQHFNDTIEYPWKRCYLVLMQVSERNEIIASDYTFSKNYPGFLRSNWEQILPLTLLDPFRLGNILDIVEATKHLDGDIVECGSFKGGSGILMGLLLKEMGSTKKVHLFDSFEGLPEPHFEKDKGYRKGQFKSDFDALKNVVKQLGLDDYVKLHKGWFDTTVPQFLLEAKGSPISVFHIDCDLYNSTMQCFPQLYTHVVDGGAIILDDYNDGGRGEKFAILETLNKLNKEEVIKVGPGSQSFFFKNKQEDTNLISDGGVWYDLSYILDHASYMDWLENTIGESYSDKLKTLYKMTNKDIISSLSLVVSEVLSLDNLDLKEDTIAKEVEGWDSISYIEIIAEVEKHFNVKFKLLELEEFNKIGDMVDCISGKIQAAN